MVRAFASCEEIPELVEELDWLLKGWGRTSTTILRKTYLIVGEMCLGHHDDDDGGGGGGEESSLDGGRQCLFTRSNAI